MFVVVYCFLNKSSQRTTAAQSPPIILRDIPLVLCVHLRQVMRDLYQLPRIVVKWVGRCGRAYVTWGRVAPCMTEKDLAPVFALTEKDLAPAFADPMEAIEQEWYRMGFRSLEQEHKVGSLSLSPPPPSPPSRALSLSLSLYIYIYSI